MVLTGARREGLRGRGGHRRARAVLGAAGQDLRGRGPRGHRAAAGAAGGGDRRGQRLCARRGLRDRARLRLHLRRGQRARSGCPRSTWGSSRASAAPSACRGPSGPTVAKELLFTGRMIGAADAARIGLVNAVVAGRRADGGDAQDRGRDRIQGPGGPARRQAGGQPRALRGPGDRPPDRDRRLRPHAGERRRPGGHRGLPGEAQAGVQGPAGGPRG
ncbi:MAG: hypothetical protein MZU95_13490 [Desulfomicrobium escambiense]|nr:hypothetical protein [Desulfomicrobium escambiense]